MPDFDQQVVNFLPGASQDAVLSALETAILGAESRMVEFAYLRKSQGANDANDIIYEIHNPRMAEKPDPLKLIPFASNLTTAQIEDRLDTMIDQGLLPVGKMFDIAVPGGLITVVPCRSTALQPPQNIDGWMETKATVFGLNMDGSPDQLDNGRGAPVLGSINTANQQVVGAALPIPILRARFGSLKAARGQFIEVEHPSKGKSIIAQIVDLGPSNEQIKKGIALDLTYKAQHDLDGNGLIDVRFRFV